MTHHPYLARALVTQRIESLRRPTARPTRNPKREFADFLHIVS